MGERAAPRPAKALAFDFDGTLADSLGVMLECVNALAERYGYAPVDGVGCLRRVPFREFMRGHLRLNPLRFLIWRRDFRRLLARERGRIRLFRGVKEVLLELKASGTPLLLLTSSPEEHSVALLRKERVDVFSRYYLGTSVSNKARAIKKAVRDAGVAPSDMIYVADEIKDAESCVQSGVRMIGVGWGMNDGGALVEAGAIRLVERTDALLTTLREYLPSVRSRPP